MAIVIGFDIHREQITFDALDDVTGELRRGRIAPADAWAFVAFWARCGGTCGGGVGGDDRLAVHRRGAGRGRATAHPAEPAETANLRGRKVRAKTDRADARHSA
jgi:hypothetical protein